MQAVGNFHFVGQTLEQVLETFKVSPKRLFENSDFLGGTKNCFFEVVAPINGFDYEAQFLFLMCSSVYSPNRLQQLDLMDLENLNSAKDAQLNFFSAENLKVCWGYFSEKDSSPVTFFHKSYLNTRKDQLEHETLIKFSSLKDFQNYVKPEFFNLG